MISATITLRTLFLISLTMLTVKSRFFDTFPELIETGKYLLTQVPITMIFLILVLESPYHSKTQKT
jgi:hypothetical protein